jgi:hypothetical protein
MEGMTELVNGTFIEDMSTLLSSCTEGKNRKTFFEIDKEFESMVTVVKSNFVTVDSFASSMWASLRQALIRKLAHVKSPDQATWIKSEDYIADDQMLTIENTDQAIKVFENCASRAIDPTTTVLLAGASHDDNPEMVTMRADLAEMKGLVATLGTTSIPTTTAGAAHTGKRAHVHNNAKTTVPKAVITCTVCKKKWTQCPWLLVELGKQTQGSNQVAKRR